MREEEADASLVNSKSVAASLSLWKPPTGTDAEAPPAFVRCLAAVARPRIKLPSVDWRVANRAVTPTITRITFFCHSRSLHKHFFLI